MSILIKGVDMPTEDCEVIIRIQPDGTVLDEHGIHLYAEAAPVPTPHGSLIDADAFIATIRPDIDEDNYNACTFATVKKLMREHINNAPTIIEAEGE